MSTHDTVTRPDCGSPVDTRALRTALGSFATGVAIVTARSADGDVMGLTVNSFNSVSMEPPLIVWSLSRTSSRFDAFQQVTHYAAHVLALEQVELAQRFATSGSDRFLGLFVSPGLGGAPLLDDYCARFECRIASRVDAGDHRMFIGAVERFSAAPRKPLVYHGGRYRKLSAQD